MVKSYYESVTDTTTTHEHNQLLRVTQDASVDRDKFKRPAAASLQLHPFVYSPGVDRQLSEACSEDSKWVETL